MAVKQITLFFIGILCAICVANLPFTVASPRTIFVPDDYPTISLAIGNAADGDTIFVRKGIYDEAQNQTLVINKEVSLVGEDAHSTEVILHPPLVATGGYKLNSSGTGLEPEYGYDNPLKIKSNNVSVSGFKIISSIAVPIQIAASDADFFGNIVMTGLFIGGSNHFIARNSLLNSGIYCGSSHCIITENNLTGGSITTAAGSDSNYIFENVVTNGFGIQLADSHSSIVARNIVENCSEGVGVHGSGGSGNVLYANIVNNNNFGLVLATEGFSNTFFANQVTNNRYGVEPRYVFPIRENNTFFHNNFINNSIQVDTDPSIILNQPGQYSVSAYFGGSFDNGKEGNYWNDYKGTDVDHNGIGDSPYTINGDLADHYPLMAPINISDVAVELPDWTSISAPLPSFPTPSLSPSPTETSLAVETPTAIPTPTNTPSPLATDSEQPFSHPTPPLIFAIMVSTISIAMIAVATTLALRKRQSKKSFYQHPVGHDVSNKSDRI
jgi:parallel beta-helix repeat protein